jgi:hypothetical protein
MKTGDVVMFIDNGCRYARWFLGQIGVVTSYTETGTDGNSHCRVEWMNPVPYHDSKAKISDFRADKFMSVAHAAR